MKSKISLLIVFVCSIDCFAGFEYPVPSHQTLTSSVSQFFSDYLEDMTRSYPVRYESGVYEYILSDEFKKVSHGELTCERPFSVKISRKVQNNEIIETIDYIGCSGGIGQLTIHRVGVDLSPTSDAELLLGGFPNSSGCEYYRFYADWSDFEILVQKNGKKIKTSVTSPYYYATINETKQNNDQEHDLNIFYQTAEILEANSSHSTHNMHTEEQEHSHYVTEYNLRASVREGYKEKFEVNSQETDYSSFIGTYVTVVYADLVETLYIEIFKEHWPYIFETENDQDDISIILHK